MNIELQNSGSQKKYEDVDTAEIFRIQGDPDFAMKTDEHSFIWLDGGSAGEINRTLDADEIVTVYTQVKPAVFEVQN